MRRFPFGSLAALVGGAAAVVWAQATPDRTFSIHPDEIPIQFEKSSGQTVLKQAIELIHVPDAWKEFSVSGSGLTAAVLDTGLRASHVDFRGRVAGQYNWTPDNNGATDNANDGHGHGTHVAGIIAASEAPPAAGASKGEHTGVAPGARVIPLKVLTNAGGGDFAWVEAALRWVVDNRVSLGITVVNMSLGDRKNYETDATFPGDKIDALIRQLRELRVPVVIAAGNDYFNAKGQGMAYPAILPSSVSVGAVYDANIGGVTYASGAVAYSTKANQMAAFSQRLHAKTGAAFRTDVFAPGAAITSSGRLNDRGEASQQGTSQAAPMTAGVILLIQEYHLRVRKELPKVDDLESWLQQGAVPVLDTCNGCDNVPDTNLSYERLDALAALRAVKKAIQP